ncbi:MAG: phosphoribosylformylglycinamidine cyclo-ligase [Spirochaetaceae bacterium]|jgi:phosphoribosylformylglycinamidine cyclo-ligase|nr:phosphoribosylformylglycinamidine cyclo-ligase [Spirochaetaceae bacterium]
MEEATVNYKEAGVDIEEGYRAVGKYRELAAGTLGPLKNSVLNSIGSFAGMFSLKEFMAPGGDSAMSEPVLVSGTDGVGTKLDIAFRMKKYDTAGIDCVAMCVNDILCHGARPLFFLDYLACGDLDADIAADLVKGVARACGETGCVLLGGETAEMPGFYDTGKYDIAGFALGIVDRKRIIDGSKIRSGDALIGLASSGPHSNGYSLIRKAIPDLSEDFGGMPIGMALLEPTRLYVRGILALLEKIEIHGMAHITGGGFYENIPRMFPITPPSFEAVINSPSYKKGEQGAWIVPPIFGRIACGIKNSGAARTETASLQDEGLLFIKNDRKLNRLMFNTFNMGIGFVLALDEADAKPAIELLDSLGYPAWLIGRVEEAEAHAGGAGHSDLAPDGVASNDAASGGAAARVSGGVRFV